MKNMALVLLLGSVCVPCAVSQQQEDPAIDGYVTRVTSSSDFDVNGFRVLCGPETQSILQTGPNETTNNTGCPQETLYVGEAASIYGSLKKKQLAVQAAEINLQKRALPAQDDGSAIIDAIPKNDPASAGHGMILVRADGYRILIDKSTDVKWAPPLDALDKVAPGDWIQYRGRLDNKGLMIAGSARFNRLYIGNRELELRGKREYDPTEVAPDAKQSVIKEAFGGVDPKKFPPFKDPAMQARIEKIGNSLIPEYQQALPDSDPAKIHFRFQLIDTKLFSDGLTLPNGIILVPHQVVERMQNDSQLATVLADDMAGALERIEYRYRSALNMTAAGVLATDATMFLPPPVDLLGIAAGATREEVFARMEQQTERVSLQMLHDAGYDVDEAPRAWWRLATKKQEPLADEVLPERAAYLYSMLGETWNNPAAATLPLH
jgi:hypothetical protein